MAEKREVFVSKDGEIFDSEAKADAADFIAEQSPKVDKWLTDNYPEHARGKDRTVECIVNFMLDAKKLPFTPTWDQKAATPATAAKAPGAGSGGKAGGGDAAKKA